jgi:membrane-associated phospholipid phosphatase
MNKPIGKELGLTIAFVVVSVLSYFYFDLKLAIFVNQQISTGAIWLAEFLSFLGKFPICILLAVSLVMLLPQTKRSSKQTYLLLFASFFVTSCICWTLKIFLGRYRPDAYFEDGLYGFSLESSDDHALHSMPSGHSSVVATLMTTLALLSPRWAPLFYVLSIVLSAARIMMGAHYFSDVLMSWLIGFLVTTNLKNSEDFFKRSFEKLKKQFNNSSNH